MLDHYPGLSPETRAFFAAPQEMMIGGERCAASGGRVLEVLDPATEQKIAEVPAATAADVDRAVAAARHAFESGPWPAAAPAQRERAMQRLAGLLEAKAAELAEIECLDNGKTLAMARLDVSLAVDYLRYMAGWATKIEGTTVAVPQPAMRGAQTFGYTLREPVGVVAAIIPWNFPLLMAAWKIGPVLATGCTMVLKPAEETPLSALRLAALVLEADIPPGVVNVVTGLGPEAGAALAAHPGVNKIAFTGSTEVGKRVGKAAMDNMTRVTLELGGKSPVIVLDDADPVRAAAGAAQAIFYNHGQVCTAGSRLYVQRKNYDNVIAEVAKRAGRLKLGAGMDPTTQMGPLVSEAQMRRVCGYIDAGMADGARVAAGGGRSGETGFFVRPTVLADARQEMRVVQEEIFGPVLVALPFDELDEVVALANGTPYGLGASVWSNDLSRVHRLIPRLRAGTVWVNTHNLVVPQLPFGGVKQSGLGREMGREVLDHYTETKSVLMVF